MMVVNAGLRERADRRAQELRILDLQHRRERHQLDMAKVAFKPPPAPGAMLAPDGKHYVRDPQRPGKYLEAVKDGDTCSCGS